MHTKASERKVHLSDENILTYISSSLGNHVTIILAYGSWFLQRYYESPAEIPRWPLMLAKGAVPISQAVEGKTCETFNWNDTLAILGLSGSYMLLTD